ncbi:MAG: sulfur carrier protein ThiS [Oscillospiraceae bacterium]|nr:sulfur carrier protein ThiS [Oscillospiraceae bacterium]
MALICGKNESEADGMKLAEYIEKAGFQKGRIAVEINGAILPKEEYEKTVIASSDEIEIVEFMGGG